MSHHPTGPRLIAVVVASSLIVVGAAVAKPLRPGTFDQRRMEALWLELEKTEGDGSRALLTLSLQPKEATAFLNKKMHPLTVSADKIRSLAGSLASDQEATWKPAFEELEYFDPRLAIDLETLMGEVTESPARQRLVEILSGRPAGSLAGKAITLRHLGAGINGYNFVADAGSWWAEHQVGRINLRPTRPKWTRAVRGIVLLEHVGTPDAVALLEILATGHPDAQPTKAARQALDSKPLNPGVRLDERQRQSLWVALERSEEEAARALLRLSLEPKETMAFLKKKMQPLKVEAAQVRTLLAKLSSDQESVWKPAFEELEHFDPRLAIDLEPLMNEVTESPARERLVEILSGRNAGSLAGKQITLRRVGNGGDGYNFLAEGSWWAEHKVSRINSGWWGNMRRKWTRAVRAMVLLEHVGTPDALAILRDMATGHPEAQPTRAARVALERISGKNR
jgi:hypothetical protein